MPRFDPKDVYMRNGYPLHAIKYGRRPKRAMEVEQVKTLGYLEGTTMAEADSKSGGEPKLLDRLGTTRC